ncbi:DUF2961 domain-containing protein [Pontibacter sp. G13]|uniref:DUF2961 domain-containing protein n=1 Tax=Pontibacter sp. G13 TaxID=3074898 RepID=UPI00288B24D6|nr:DUF2961 domain-containing protein [Pontibacter sp. G13]WNJ17439.1 DUF2961 domain-containing protein [Pontibacter sp. G13]
MGQIYQYQPNTQSKGIWESIQVDAQSRVIFSDIQGPAIIQKLWLSTFPFEDKDNLELANQVFIHLYWENSDRPAVSAPLSDFFCQSLRLQAIDNHFFQATNNQLLFTTTLPMPFRHAAKLEIENRLDKSFELFFGIDLEFKEIDKDAMYLHTHWQQINDLPPDEPFMLLPALTGQGRYLGTHLSLYQRNIHPNWPWYTRPVTVYLDASTPGKEPSLYIKTLDDFFGSAWWDREPEHHVYSFPYFGRPVVELAANGDLEIALYKYHIPDSLWFHESIQIEIGKNWNWGNQVIGNGTWTTTSFLYLKAPSKE